MASYPDRIPSATQGENFVSLRSVMKHGNSEGLSDLGSLGERQYNKPMTFDPEGQGKVGEAYRTARQSMFTSMDSDEKLRAAAASGNQAAYEERLTYLATKSRDSQPLISSSAYTLDGRKSLDLNKMQEDGVASEYKCRQLSYITGALLTEADDRAVASGLRSEPTDFRLAQGGKLNSMGQSEFEPHQFIVSANTGNVIEPTVDKYDSPYRPTNTTFQEMVAGQPAYAERDNGSKSLYADIYNANNPHIDARKAALDAGDFDRLSQLQHPAVIPSGMTLEQANRANVDVAKSAVDQAGSKTLPSVSAPQTSAPIPDVGVQSPEISSLSSATTALPNASVVSSSAASEKPDFGAMLGGLKMPKFDVANVGTDLAPKSVGEGLKLSAPSLGKDADGFGLKVPEMPKLDVEKATSDWKMPTFSMPDMSDMGKVLER